MSVADNDPFLRGPGQPGSVGRASLGAGKGKPSRRTDNAVRPAAYLPNSRQTTSAGGNANNTPSPETDTTTAAQATFTPAEPRVPPTSTSTSAPGGNAANRPGYSEEYLADGGDRANPVHYDRFHRLGLDTEDTVAEYVDHTGERHVKPSNRVRVYAPRFRALRTISRPSADFAVDKVAGNLQRTAGSGLRQQTSSVHHSKPVGSEGIRMRSRASGMEARADRAELQQETVAADHVKLINLYQNLSFLRSGRFRQSEEARLAEGIDAAFTWTRDQNPVIVAETKSAQQVKVRFKPQRLVGTDESHKSAGRLRIVKLADKKTASSGDVLTFTIRYDNLGDRKLHHVRIIDNLTPRLEYVADSGESDRPGEFTVEDNAEGSSIVKFELAQPLSGHTGGVITFRVRVR